MTTTTSTTLMRDAVKLDGAATLPSGVLVAALAGVLDEPLGIATGVLLGVGLAFAVWGAVVLYLGTRPEVRRGAAIAVGIVNLVCAVDGVTLALVTDLTTLGMIALLIVAVIVAAIGLVQLYAARR